MSPYDALDVAAKELAAADAAQLDALRVFVRHLGTGTMVQKTASLALLDKANIAKDLAEALFKRALNAAREHWETRAERYAVVDRG